MFVNIGEDYVISSSELLSIIEYQIFMSSDTNRLLLDKISKEDGLLIINEQVKKSVILLEGDKKIFAIISPVSVSTIANRFVNFNDYYDNYLSEGD